MALGIVSVIQNAVMTLPWGAPARSLLLHPAGPFTIFFWAPTFKWLITIANIGDFSKPAENISANQQIAISATGVIWARYATQITPINYNLMIVNMFMGLSGLYQLYRKTQVPAEKGGFWGNKK